VRAAFFALAVCACGDGAVDVPAEVDGCVGVFAIDDDVIADAAFDEFTTRQRREHENNSPTPEERGFGEFNVTFSRCRRDDTSITCRADVADIDACRRDRLPAARAILDRTAPTARVDCTSLCEVE
jgi:hypothetical protein